MSQCCGHVLTCSTIYTFQEGSCGKDWRTEFCKSWGRPLGSATQRAEKPWCPQHPKQGWVQKCGTDTVTPILADVYHVCVLGFLTFQDSFRGRLSPGQRLDCVPAPLSWPDRARKKDGVWGTSALPPGTPDWIAGRKDTYHVWAPGFLRLLGTLWRWKSNSHGPWTAARDSLTWQDSTTIARQVERWPVRNFRSINRRFWLDSSCCAPRYWLGSCQSPPSTLCMMVSSDFNNWGTSITFQPQF